MPVDKSSIYPIAEDVVLMKYALLTFEDWIEKRKNEGRYLYWNEREKIDRHRFYLCKAAIIELYYTSKNYALLIFKNDEEFENIKKTSPKFRKYLEETENPDLEDLSESKRRELVAGKLLELRNDPDEALIPVIERSFIQALKSEFKNQFVMSIKPSTRPASYLVGVILLGLYDILLKSPKKTKMKFWKNYQKIPGDFSRTYEEMTAFFQYFTKIFPPEIREMFPLTFDAVRSRHVKLLVRGTPAMKMKAKIIRKIYNNSIEELIVRTKANKRKVIKYVRKIDKKDR